MFEEAVFQIIELWKRKALHNLKGSFWEISSGKTMNTQLGLEKL